MLRAAAVTATTVTAVALFVACAARPSTATITSTRTSAAAVGRPTDCCRPSVGDRANGARVSLHIGDRLSLSSTARCGSPSRAGPLLNPAAILRPGKGCTHIPGIGCGLTADFAHGATQCGDTHIDELREALRCIGHHMARGRSTSWSTGVERAVCHVRRVDSRTARHSERDTDSECKCRADDLQECIGCQHESRVLRRPTISGLRTAGRRTQRSSDQSGAADPRPRNRTSNVAPQALQ